MFPLALREIRKIKENIVFQVLSLPWLCEHSSFCCFGFPFLFCYGKEGNDFFLNLKIPRFWDVISPIFAGCKQRWCPPVALGRAREGSWGWCCEPEASRLQARSQPCCQESQGGSAAAASFSFPFFFPSVLLPASLQDLAFFRLCDRQAKEHHSTVMPWGGIFSSLQFGALGGWGGKALSEQIVVLLLYKVLSIWLPLKSCCLVFQFICATFKSAHLPSFLRLVVVRVPNYPSSALPPVLTISSKLRQPMGSGDCWTGMLAGGSAYMYNTTALFLFLVTLLLQPLKII